MQLGMIGLGRMGGNMVRRLLRGGHQSVVFDRNPESVAALVEEGAVGAATLEELVGRLSRPRAIWLMVPSGETTDSTIAALAPQLAAGDAIVDGGNGFFKDDVRRARELIRRGIHYIDVGTSGGVWGLERGYCLMIGGDAGVVGRLDPIFRTLAPGRESAPLTPGRAGLTSTAEEGYVHCGPSGAGHFVKMVHNGIEYGLMQAYGEGLDLLHSARQADGPARYEFDLREIAELWRRGSVIGSWLLDLTAGALAADPWLERYEGHVEDSGEGRWAIETAIENAVPVEVLSSALYARFRSRVRHTFAEKVLSAMRHQFGGHAEKPAGG